MSAADLDCWTVDSVLMHLVEPRCFAIAAAKPADEVVRGTKRNSPSTISRNVPDKSFDTIPGDPNSTDVR